MKNDGDERLHRANERRDEELARRFEAADGAAPAQDCVVAPPVTAEETVAAPAGEEAADGRGGSRRRGGRGRS